MRALLLPLLFSTLLFSCNKKESKQLPAGSVPIEEYNARLKALGECSGKTKKDSATIADKLIGTWKLQLSYNSWTNIATRSDKEVLITFLPNRTLTIKAEGTSDSARTWKMDVEDSVYWGIEVDPNGSYLSGRIIICDTEVMFSSSYLDGPDYLFSKVQ